EHAGIGADTPDPEGGRIVRDAEGRPTGLLLERAAELVIRCIPPASDADAEAALLDAQAELHRHGITAVHCVPNIHVTGPDPLPFLEDLRARDLLRLRVLVHLPLESLDDAIRVGLRSGFGGEWIRIGALKMFLDGALGSLTAWLREPYVGRTDHGIQVLPADEFAVTVRRAGAAGITASVQPCHVITDWRAAERHWGPERCRSTYAFRSLQEGGAVLAFGSDAPVEPADPRRGLFAAVARQDLQGEPAGGWFPAERLTAADALRAYTAGPAFAAGLAGRLGTLSPGAAADFAAWDEDPLELDAPAILHLRCLATAVAGELVWSDIS